MVVRIFLYLTSVDAAELFIDGTDATRASERFSASVVRRVPRPRRSLSRARGRPTGNEERSSLVVLKSEWHTLDRMRWLLAFCHHRNYGVQPTPGLRLSSLGPKNLLSNVTNCFTRFASLCSRRRQKATAAGDVRRLQTLSTPCDRCTSCAVRPFKPILTTSWLDNKVNDALLVLQLEVVAQRVKVCGCCC